MTDLLDLMRTMLFVGQPWATLGLSNMLVIIVQDLDLDSILAIWEKWAEPNVTSLVDGQHSHSHMRIQKGLKSFLAFLHYEI